MLEPRPNCELCDRVPPPDATDARICSCECTYCADCVERLHNVCPTCGGNLVPRPTRPRRAWRDTHRLGMGHHPARATRVHAKSTAEDIAAHVARIGGIAPADR